ncbi:ABC transporter substrate-binding protein [Candidatus Bathyarchaeota archaeon]|nr:ABC transporter substrate-binding protein [Candidatus Bathyarchaeota archaeon]
MSRRTVYLVVLAVGVALVSGYSLWSARQPGSSEPEGEPASTEVIEPQLIQIGVMSATTDTYDRYVFLGDLALDDVNAYCNQSGIAFRFEPVYSDAEGMSATALGNIQQYHGAGIDLVIGCGWSSQLCVSMSYIEHNGMVVISPTSTNPQDCTRKVDGVFKMSPIETRHAVPAAAAAESLGASHVLIIYRGDAWAEHLIIVFKQEYSGRLTEMRYAAETTGDGFGEYMSLADQAVRESAADGEKTVVLALSFSEAVDILGEASRYPALMNATWLRADGERFSKDVIDEVGAEAAAVKLIGPYPAMPDTETMRELDAAYRAEFGEPLGYFDANVYDSLWVMALSVVEAGSADGDAVEGVLPKAAEGYRGLTGLCLLDAVGDRDHIDCELWGYYMVDGEAEGHLYGYYNATSRSVNWDVPVSPG